jgi:uncharacterized membrane protein YkgB
LARDIAALRNIARAPRAHGRVHMIVNPGLPAARNETARGGERVLKEATSRRPVASNLSRQESFEGPRDCMKISFNIAENGAGSYRFLAILRWVMVVIFVSFGMQKFTLQSAQGIVQFISNSPFISWLSVFGLRGEAYFLGVAELGIAALLVAGAFSPVLSAIGALIGMVTFAITWSFFFTTPGVVVWSWSTDPMAWSLAGEFIFKDIVLLCVCTVLFLASLPRMTLTD